MELSHQFKTINVCPTLDWELDRDLLQQSPERATLSPYPSLPESPPPTHVPH